MDSEPAKKRGRPRKVVVEETGAVEKSGSASASGGVRNASTKTGGAKTKVGNNEGGGVKKGVKSSTSTTPTAKPASGTATTMTAKATGAAKAAKTNKVTKSATASKGTIATKGKTAAAAAAAVEKTVGKAGGEGDGERQPVAAKQTYPVTAATSKILNEVAKTGTLKTMATGTTTQAAVVEKAKARAIPEDVHADTSIPKTTVRSAPATPSSSAQKPVASSSIPPTTPTPTPTPSSTPPTSVPRPTNLPPSPPPPPKTTPPPPPKPTPRATTIPLPRTPINPYTYTHTPAHTTSAPAPPRPKPLSAEAIEKQQIEQAIREGRMPQKYKPAARRVLGLMVGIPVVIVFGWELWKRYDRTIRTKFEVEMVEKTGRGEAV
ncbi:hypothetical protein CC80DRAFT_497133 [Byssothecium circinans]|uniref:Uncharacterized protein n=1 Tax=Byssothecium circinans TaxID=147558 RepID=A0A6A5TCA9_9PLEO|nr:hypothetical protein CC80DRAFT_497133 [Byssothecium circinans]